MSAAALAQVPSLLSFQPGTPAPAPPAVLQPSFIVPNEAALLGINDNLYPSGSTARVMSHLDDFELLKASTLPLTANLIVATQSGVGRWVRCLQPDAEAWLAETEWRIDFATGNDENAGRNASPLRTWAELMRRWSGASGEVYHTVSKTVRVTSLGPTDAMDFGFGTAPGVIVNVIGDLTVAFSGTISAKTDLSEVAPGTANAAVSTWTNAQVGRLVRDVTNNRWSMVNFDLGAVGADRNLELAPWANLDVVNGSTTVTTGNSTVGAAIEVYTCPVVAAVSNLRAIGSATGQVVGVLVQQLEFTGQHTNFSGIKLCVQNCPLGSVRFQPPGPVILNNTTNLNGAPFEASASGALVTLNAGRWPQGMGNNNNGVGCTFDVRSNTIFNSQIQMNRRGFLRIRNMFVMRCGGASCINLRDGSLCGMSSTSSLCGTGNSGINFFIVGSSGVQIESGTAVAVCKLSSGALPIAFDNVGTCNAFDPVTGTYSVPRNLTYANIDATFGAGGFGGGAFDPRFGCFFQVNPVAP